MASCDRTAVAFVSEVGRVKATSGSEGANISYSVLDSEFFAVNRAVSLFALLPSFDLL